MLQIHCFCQNLFQKSGITVDRKFLSEGKVTHESLGGKYKAVSPTAANEHSVHPERDG